jgi:hypothetical protein
MDELNDAMARSAIAAPVGHSEFVQPSSRLDHVLRVGQLEQDKRQKQLVASSTSMATSMAAPAAAPPKNTGTSIWDGWDLWATPKEPDTQTASTTKTTASDEVPPLSNATFRKPTDSVTNSVLGTKPAISKVQDPLPAVPTQPVSASVALVAGADPTEVAQAVVKAPLAETVTAATYDTTKASDFTTSSDELHFAHGGLWHPYPEAGELAVVLTSSPNGLEEDQIADIKTAWLPVGSKVGNMEVVHENVERVWREAEF